jgi:hypothetical protein
MITYIWIEPWYHQWHVLELSDSDAWYRHWDMLMLSDNETKPMFHRVYKL